MAFSSSIKRAQEIRLCDLCEEESVKWRCIDCDMCLCEKCKNFHLRVPVTSQHQIVTIGTPLKYVQKKIVIDNIPCKDHPRKMACLFCRSCDSLICPDCASSGHNKHNFDSMQSALDRKLDYLRGIQEKINENIKRCESKTSDIQNTKPQYNAKFDDSVTNIKQKEKDLIDAIKKQSTDFQEKIENERFQMNKCLSKIEKDINSTKKNLEDQRNEMDAILASNQGTVIFTANVTIEDPKFDSLPHQIQQFIPETESPKKLQESFGALQKLSIPTTHVIPKMDFEVIESFTTDMPLIDTLVISDETSAWINCWHTELIRKVNIPGNTMTTLQELSMKVYDMAVNSNDELLLCMYDGSDVKLLKRSGELKSIITEDPLLLRGIHVTKDNDIILTVKEAGNEFTPTDQSQRALIVYDVDGKQKHKYQYDKDGQTLYTLLRRVTTNGNQDILVVDKTSVSTGRVVVINKEGNFRWLYNGHPEINAAQQFDPRDIVTTTVGNIIISDYRSHALHVLSEDGDILACKVMRAIGIRRPFGLDIDNKGRLWLGCGTSKNSTNDAKLHIMKLMS